MENKKAFGVFFMLLIIMIAHVTIPHVEAKAEPKLCIAKSNKFKGFCLKDPKCVSVCKTEGFTGGRCRGFRLRCYCTKTAKHC
ncbi:defensin Ec-AMP-D2-like [Sesamum indicum]|uniref:Defensin Ec-AMP-D2-like n=1 Tax=Sesamum indicum TaxID=4182 RepID=A0A6I9UXV1_SESIN|nr:defensin Ec-AMP-D2-like [Sesamum indicum]